eukprot:6147375-Pleurochrysis_carterae.AAC.1
MPRVVAATRSPPQPRSAALSAPPTPLALLRSQSGGLPLASCLVRAPCPLVVPPPAAQSRPLPAPPRGEPTR